MAKRQRTTHVQYSSIVDGKLKGSLDKKAGKEVTNLIFFDQGELFKGILPIGSMASSGHIANDGFMDEFPHKVHKPISVYLITIMNYKADGLHSIHEIAAVKHKGLLYCFNAWGKDSRSVDMTCFNKVAELSNSSIKMVYKGDDLQKGNRLGACAGLAGNFAFEVVNHINMGNIPRIEEFTQDDYNKVIAENLTCRSLLINSKSTHPHNIFAALRGPSGLSDGVQTTPNNRGNRNYNSRKKKAVIANPNSIMTNAEEIYNTEMSSPENEKLNRALGGNGFHTWLHGNLTGAGINYKSRNDAYKNYVTFAKSSQSVILNREEFNEEARKYDILKSFERLSI
jgi:hypothetical protein